MADGAHTEALVLAHDHAVLALAAWRESDRRTLAPLRMAVTFAGEYERLLTDGDVLDNLDRARG